MSGLDELTREDMVALVIKLHETVQAQQKESSELKSVVRRQAERIERFIGELLTFVQHPEVPSDNNAAERAIRPAVVARKISGGTRSEKGSKTSSVLRTLFETWAIQGRNTIDACRDMLAAAATTSPAQ